MNKKLFVLFGMSFLLVACLNNMEKKTDKHTLAIQLILDSVALTSIRNEVVSVVNEIIRQELALPQTEKFDAFFSPKKINRLSLYYVNDADEKGDDLLFFALENSVKESAVDVSITSKVDFFKGPFGIDDELVIMIDDSKKELLGLNQKIKNVAHAINQQFKEQYDHDLYDISKSEAHDYVPHVGLGRIRSNSIKEHMKDQALFDETFKRIQQRIKEALCDKVKKYAEINQKNSVEEISVLDLKTQKYIKRLK